MDKRIQLGAHVRDKVTGFSGHVTGRAEYITGCAQVLVQPQVKESGEFVEARWFDETRLSVTEAAPVAIDDLQHDTGADAPAPIK